MGETIDDALATRRTVPVSLEPFEGEGRTGTVAQEPFEPGTVTGRDMDRGIDAEPTGGLPREHVIGDVTFEQAVAVEVTEHAVANRVLEFVQVGSREVGGLVELDRALGILAEVAVDDTDVEVKVCSRLASTLRCTRRMGACRHDARFGRPITVRVVHPAL